MSQLSFSDILEAADQLSLHEQEDLIHILENRLREYKRAMIVQDVHEAQQEFAEGQCQPTTPEQLMQEILS